MNDPVDILFTIPAGPYRVRLFQSALKMRDDYDAFEAIYCLDAPELMPAGSHGQLFHSSAPRFTRRGAMRPAPRNQVQEAL